MYGTSTGSHCACAPWSAEVAGVARLFRVSRFIQALSAGFTPLAVPLPDACCLPLTSLLTCGLFRQLLHSLEGARKRIAPKTPSHALQVIMPLAKVIVNEASQNISALLWCAGYLRNTTIELPKPSCSITRCLYR